MSVDELTSTERRDVRVFAVGLGVIAFAGVVIAITRSTWRASHWAGGVSAAAASAQAIAVVLALVYASRQVALAREVARRERVATILDQLAPVLFEDLSMAYDRFRSLASQMAFLAEMHRDRVIGEHDDHGEVRRGLIERFDQVRIQLESAYEDLHRWSDRADRLMSTLGYSQSVVVRRFDLEVLRIDPFEMSRKVITDDGVGLWRSDELQSAYFQLRNLVGGLLTEYAPIQPS